MMMMTTIGDIFRNLTVLKHILTGLIVLSATLHLSEENPVSDSSNHQTTAAVLREYCQQQYFTASCKDNDDVIVMEIARYGRMKEGKCITGNYGKLNCSKDALWYFDRRCSGRNRCSVLVGDPNLVRLNPCHAKDLVSYLEAKYYCVKAASGSTQLCRGNRPLLLTNSVGYIASELAVNAGIATPDCPVRIQAPVGQRIQLTLLFFAGKESGDEGDDPLGGYPGTSAAAACFEIGSVYSGGQSRMLTACSGTSSRGGGTGGTGGSGVATVLFRSETNNATVELHTKYNLKDLAPFVIKYESFGCQSPPVPAGGWVRTRSDIALIGCNGSDQESWTLTCIGSRWIGSVGNCSSQSSPLGASAATQTDDTFPYGILVVVAIGVALGVFIGGTLLTIVAFCMKRARPDSGLTADCLSAEIMDDSYGRSDAIVSSDLRCTVHEDRRYRLNPVVPLMAGNTSCYPPLSSEQAETLTTVYDDQDVILCRTGKVLNACPASACTALIQPVPVNASGGIGAPPGHRSVHLYETPQFG